MKITEMLKNRNRTLLELQTGIVFWTVVAGIVGAMLPLDTWGFPKALFLISLAASAVLAVTASLHMQRCLERALDADEGTASKLIVRGYLIRYLVLAVVMTASALTGVLEPLTLCLGYILLMKAAAYSQPFTHKLYNRLFHESDPVPEPVPDEEWNRKI